MYRVAKSLVTAAVSVVLVGTSASAPASATSVASGSRSLCASATFSCVSASGYRGQSTWGSWGPGHNCVSYVAYRLAHNGARDPWTTVAHDAKRWDEDARSVGVRVNKVPAVGAIAQWDGGRYGHVAYVERVTASFIVVSEDSYISDTSGYSAVRRISRGTAEFAAADFLHFHDVAPAHR